MDNFSEEKLKAGLDTGFFNTAHITSDPAYRPELLKNRTENQETVLSAIIKELESCESFDFSVAFITSDGLACLLPTFNYLKDHNVHGRILTTNYLNFTDPGSLSKILQFPNITLKVYTKGPFHPKGYIFKQTDYYSLVIGSSNLTQNALKKNQEWNLKLLSCTDGELLYSTRKEFERVWDEAEPVNQNWLDSYSALYENVKKNRKFIPVETLDVLEDSEIFEDEDEIQQKSIIPNKMQNAALLNLNELRIKGEKKALLVAATGTGKTYLAAFDVLQVKPKKVLYIVGRETILKKSEKSFKRILGKNIKTGFLTGKEKAFDCDYLFANSYTLKNDKWLTKFSKDTFDYVIVDEVHHGGAATYQKIMDYFTPEFLLGLTATPERSDKFDIFKQFNYNIASEIRLKDALEANLLCPFHYYGVTDITVNGEEIDDKSDFAKLVADERIRHIKDTIELYSNNSEKRKGLIFCPKIKEGQELSKKLNEIGFNTVFLSGADDEEIREATISRLESDEDNLEFIISVDILNEGIDIPAVNQVVMLRPTQSSIIFVQQLGRGLRKNQNKAFLTVIDFIGNYDNNFLIPIALFGENSQRKDKIRKIFSDGSNAIPGASTIDIEQIAKKRIYQALDKISFQKSKLLKEQYELIKKRIGHIPCMMDFINNNGIDPMNFVEYMGKSKKNGVKRNSYIEFACWVEEISSGMTEDELMILRFVSEEIAKGIRLYEIVMLLLLINNNHFTREEVKTKFATRGAAFLESSFDCAIRVLDLSYFKSQSGELQKNYKLYNSLSFIEEKGGLYTISSKFLTALKNDIFVKNILDILSYSEYNWLSLYSHTQDHSDLVLYQNYTRKDVSKILNWNNDNSTTMYGYRVNIETKTCPIFVNYEKEINVQGTATNYDDKFIDNSMFSWMSRPGLTLNSKEIKEMLELSTSGLLIPMFIQKSKTKKDGSGEHYYIGNCKVLNSENTTRLIDGKKTKYVNITFEIYPPVRDDMYTYIADNLDDDLIESESKLA